jgi:MSHA biogenesis protein MshP
LYDCASRHEPGPLATFLNKRQSGFGRAERGFSLVSAIFILVVLAALGAAMVSFFSIQQQSTALDVQGARAYQAARAGIEWAAYQGIKNAAAFACATAGSSSDAIAFTGDLASFTTTVGCSSAAHDEGGNTVRVYSIVSTAKSGAAGGADYVERVLAATISLCTAPGGGAC